MKPMTTPPAFQPDCLLRDRQIYPLLGISRAHFWKLVKQGTLPAPIKLSPNVTAWKSNDILDYLANLVA